LPSPLIDNSCTFYVTHLSHSLLAIFDDHKVTVRPTVFSCDLGTLKCSTSFSVEQPQFGGSPEPAVFEHTIVQ
ncbi:MAG: hypothetical protein VX443_04245, partial [Pseudomonadota bacterium]|nr:hypothetical protein [Pseudomonadota bacterium]